MFDLRLPKTEPSKAGSAPLFAHTLFIRILRLGHSIQMSPAK
jgi:hypothetical protein